MPDLPAIVCPDHGVPLLSVPDEQGTLRCPRPGCFFAFGTGKDQMLAQSSPLTYLEQGAAQRHELVRSHEAAGFSRSEAMQVLCTVIAASIMKGAAMADPPGTFRRIADLQAEADRLARKQAAGAGIREGTVLPVAADGKTRQMRVTSIEVLGNNAVRLTCVPEGSSEAVTDGAVFEYDGDTGALYYRLTREPVARTIDIDGRVMVGRGSPPGRRSAIEVLDAPGFSVSVSTPAPLAWTEYQSWFLRRWRDTSHLKRATDTAGGPEAFEAGVAAMTEGARD